MQGCFDRRNATIQDVANLVQRVTKNVHQNDAAALRDRQPHEGSQARRDRKSVVYVSYRVDNHFEILIRMKSLLPRAAPEKIQRCIVGDADEPAFHIGDRSSFWERFDGFHHNFLDYVLAIDDGARHARTVAMQLRP